MDPISIRNVAVDSPEKLNSLFDMVKKADSYYLQTIQNVLLVPLFSRLGDSLENREHSDVKIKTIGVVKLVLEKTELQKVQALKTILIVLAKQVYDFQSAQLLSNVSEELQMSVLECLEVANRRASTDCVQECFRDSSSQMCQIMYSILLLLDKSDSREVKLKAIAALMSLLHVDDESDLDDIVLRSEIAGVVFFAVPMIWSSLSRLILNDPKIGRRVIERSLCALGRILCLIMEDDKVIDMGEKELILDDFRALLRVSSEPKESLQSVLDQKEKKRTPKWLRAAGKKLREPFQNLISLTGHEMPEIRKAIGVCCELWVKRCNRSLQDNLDTFTEILLILSEDEDPSIGQHFSQVIDEMQQSRGSRSFFVAVNRELIERHLLRMSRIIYRKSAREQLTALALLKAQLKRMSEEDLVLVLSNGKTLDVFVMNLLLFVEYNADNPELLKEEHSTRNYVDGESTLGRLKPWEDFKYIDSRSSQVLLLLHEMIKCLRGRTGTRILIEHLMDLLHNRPRNVAEVLKILQSVMSSCSAEADSEILEKLAEELLDERYWNLSYRIVRNSWRGAGGAGGKEHLKVSEHTEGLYESSLVVKYVDLSQESANNPEDEYFVSPCEAKANVLVTCVLMETIAVLGHKMGAEKFQKIVFHTLFNLLANSGKSNVCIHSAGLFALTEISRVYELQGIRELIMKNTDYVLFFVNQALTQRERSESALDVVSVLLEFCSRDVLGYVELIVNQLLNECSKYYKMTNLSAYLRIFGLFLKNLSGSSDVASEDTKSADEILHLWMDVLRPKSEEENDSNVDEEEITTTVDENPEKKEDVSTEIEIARQVMKVALKHISSKNLPEVIAAMETLTWGVAILRQREDDLLPLVHQIWAPLSKRFTDESPLVLRQSLKMLITLADSAKEFIHRRTVDEVVPTLNRILRTGLVVVNKSSDEGCGRFTQHFKLVQEILGNYHVIVIRLAIKQKHLDGILSSVVPYLSKNSPKLLAAAAREFFVALRSYDGAAVHQKLASCNYQDEV